MNYIISKEVPNENPTLEQLSNLGLMREGMEKLAEHPCEAIVKTNVLYNGKSVYMVRYNGKCGIMDASGLMIVPAQYDAIIAPDSFKDKNTFCVGNSLDAALQGCWGMIRLDGTQVTSIDAFYKMQPFQNGLYKVGKRIDRKVLYGIVNVDGEEVWSIKYSALWLPINGSTLIVAEYKGQYSACTIEGNVIIQSGKYDYMEGYDRGLARVRVGKDRITMANHNSKLGIINEKAEEVLPIINYNVSQFYGTSKSCLVVEEVQGECKEIRIADLIVK